MIKESIREKIAIFFVTGFYSGYSPVASGTAGSFVGLLFYLLIPGFENNYIILPMILLFTLIGFWSGSYAEKRWGKDPGEAVIDEIVGMWITLLFLPKTILIAAIAFILCRLFDIIKPFPANISQKLPGGYGIMIDDIIAGIYSLMAMHVILHLASWIRYI